MKKQTLVIVVARYQIQHGLITPLSKILPSLSLLYPVRLYTSMKREIKAHYNLTLYDSLVQHLEEEEGQCNVNQTLKKVLVENEKNFRVCVIGNENIDWSVVMDFKRKSIVIDTIGSNPQLFQISYVTGGLNKKVSDEEMLKTFLISFGLKSKTRKMLKPEGKKDMEFSLKCSCCDLQLKGSFLACSVCLAPYGHRDKIKKKFFQCKECGYKNNIIDFQQR